MPPKSEKQRRWAYAVEAGDVPGVAPSVGRKVLGRGERPKKPTGPKKARKKK
jgi:hypothetical protein